MNFLFIYLPVIIIQLLYVTGFVYAKEYGLWKHNPRYIWSFTYYFVVSFVLAIPSTRGWKLHFLITSSSLLYTFFELCFFFYLFSKVVYQHRFINRMMLVAAGIIVLCVADIIRLRNLNNFDLYVLLDLFALSTLCILYFKKIYRYDPENNLLKDPFFWIASGCLIYFLGTIPLFLFEFLQAKRWMEKLTPTIRLMVYGINSYLYIVMLLLFIKGFTCRRKRFLIEKNIG